MAAYTDEADMLNVVVFGCTAKQWREANPDRVKNNENIRDMASINDLTILSNIESHNSLLIKQNINKEMRFNILSEIVNEQRKVLEKTDFIKSINKLSDTTYVDSKKNLNNFNKSLMKGLSYNPKYEE